MHAVLLIEELLEAGDFSFLFINMEPERFETCFSKYEMVSGLEIITSALNRRSIPCFSVHTEVRGDAGRLPVSSDRDNPADIPMKSVYDDKFKAQFRELVQIVPEPVEAGFYDVFSFSGLKGEISGTGLKKVLICGFDSEREILASVIGAVREGFTPVVMSDCVSSKSERVFFEVMNVLSRWAVIGDTRDIQKMWDLW